MYNWDPDTGLMVKLSSNDSDSGWSKNSSDHSETELLVPDIQRQSETEQIVQILYTKTSTNQTFSN